MSSNINRIKEDCLAASLTLLHYHGIISESCVVNALNTGGYDKLFELLADKYDTLEID